MTDRREDRLIERATALAQADERVDALLLYGSRAGGTADEHSDVDLGLIPSDEWYDAVVAGAPRLISALGEPLFLEWFQSPNWLHAILGDGAEMELLIQRADEIDLELPHRILFDRGRIADRAGRAAGAPSEDAPDAGGVRAMVHWFWHDVGHLITALARGRTWWAYGQLEQLRSVCVRLTRARIGAPVEDDEPYWKLDDSVAAEELAWLRATIVQPDPEPMRAAALLVIERYRSLAHDAAAASDFEYPERLDALLTARLRELPLSS